MAENTVTESLEESLGDIMKQVDLSKLPPELMQRLDKSKIERIFQSAKSLSILVTGKTGSGKSTMINGILGMKMGDSLYAEEGASIRVTGTSVVTPYKKKKGKIMVVVWDSPGLQDGSTQENQDDYLRQMKDKCSEVDLCLFCVALFDTKFPRGTDNPNVVTMIKLTEAFGHQFWNNAIVVLTFANMVESMNAHKWYKMTPKAKAKAFEDKIDEWKEQIRIVLEEDVHVPKEIIDKIKIVPAGLYTNRKLPDREYWLSDLWFECMDTLPTPEAQSALLQMTTPRMRTSSEVTEYDFKQEPEVQPIVIETHRGAQKKDTSSFKKDVLTVIGFASGGGVAGAVVGVAAIAGGPIGVAIGVPAGFLLGVCIGLSLGFHKISEAGSTLK